MPITHADCLYLSVLHVLSLPLTQEPVDYTIDNFLTEAKSRVCLLASVLCILD